MELKTEYQRQLAEIRIKQREQEKQLIAIQKVLDDELRKRTRLARELNDGLGNMLAGVKCNLEALRESRINRGKGGNGGSRGNSEGGAYYACNKAIRKLNCSMAETRHVAHRLMPCTLSRYGLKTAMTELCKAYRAVEFVWNGSDSRLADRKKEVMAYRIIRELINNALNHANVTKINVNVVRETGCLSFTVINNGKAEPTDYKSTAAELAGIYVWVAACNGRIDAVSDMEVKGELRV